MSWTDIGSFKGPKGDTPTATDIGLGNVDNTSDTDKPVSTAQQAALDSKLAKTANAASASKLATARTIAGHNFDGTQDVVITAGDVGAATAAQGGRADNAFPNLGAPSNLDTLSTAGFFTVHSSPTGTPIAAADGVGLSLADSGQWTQLVSGGFGGATLMIRSTADPSSSSWAAWRNAIIDDGAGNVVLSGATTTTRVSVQAEGEAGVELLSASGGRRISLIQSASGNVGLYDRDAGNYPLTIAPDNSANLIAPLTINTSTADDAPIIFDGPATQYQLLRFNRGGVRRWSAGIDSNATGNFRIFRYSDTGTYLGSTLDFSRSTGNATFYGSVTAADHINSSSDERLKHAITPRQARTRLADMLRFCEWLWNRNDAQGVGLIAQQVQKVAPEYVSEFEHADGPRLAIDKASIALECVIGLAERVRALEAAQ